MIPINKRKIGMSVFFSIITFGIYAIYWQYLLVQNTKAVKKDTSDCIGETARIVLVPFYALYWWNSRGNLLKAEFEKHGYTASCGGGTYLIIGLLCLLFLPLSPLTALFSLAILQRDFNALETLRVENADLTKPWHVSEQVAPSDPHEAKGKAAVLLLSLASLIGTVLCYFYPVALFERFVSHFGPQYYFNQLSLLRLHKYIPYTFDYGDRVFFSIREYLFLSWPSFSFPWRNSHSATSFFFILLLLANLLLILYAAVLYKNDKSRLMFPVFFLLIGAGYLIDVFGYFRRIDNIYYSDFIFNLIDENYTTTRVFYFALLIVSAVFAALSLFALISAGKGSAGKASVILLMVTGSVWVAAFSLTVPFFLLARLADEFTRLVVSFSVFTMLLRSLPFWAFNIALLVFCLNNDLPALSSAKIKQTAVKRESVSRPLNDEPLAKGEKPTAADSEESLRLLKKMHDLGAINDEEFQKKCAEIVSRL